MLGDGSISHRNRSRDKKRGKIGPSTGNCRFAMTMDVYSINYLLSLFNEIFYQFSTSSLAPFPNINLPQHEGKSIKQYSLTRQSLSLFTRLQSIWDRYDRELNV